MILIFLTWAIVTALYGAVAWLAVRRVMAHLQGNAEATRMVVEHVLMPILGRNPETAAPLPSPPPASPPETAGDEATDSSGVPETRQDNLLRRRTG